MKVNSICSKTHFNGLGDCDNVKVKPFFYL